MYKEIIQKIQKNEDQSTYSQEQVFEIVTQMLLGKCEEYKNDVGIEDLKKNWRKGIVNLVGLLGLAHGAHFIGDMSQPKSEREKSPTYQRIQQGMKQNRKPAVSAGISEKVDPVKQAYEQARQEGQSIIDKHQSKNSNIDSFLNTISMNESSGGKNLNHKQIKEGLHAGDSAVGQYGLMPNTIKEMAIRMGKDNPMYQYANMKNSAVTDSMKKNPEHENEIAKFMANHLHDKFGGDENKMAYAWNMGHNLTDDHFNTSHKDYMNHDYVKKYQNHKKMLSQTKDGNDKVASNE